MRRLPLVLALLVVACTLVVFAPAADMGFVGDDVLIVERLRTIGGLDAPGAYFQFGFFSFYRPVTFLSHALDWEFWRLNPRGYHITNVLLHAGNAVLVFVLGRRLMAPMWAGVGAVLFALHASHHEPVFWIAGRFDLMATWWTLLGLVALGRAGWFNYAAGLACFALGLLSKESALALPLMAASADVFVHERPARDVRARLLGLGLVLGAYVVLRSQLGGLDPTGGTSRLPKALALVGSLLALAWLAGRDWKANVRGLVSRPWMPGIGAVAVIGLFLASVLPATAAMVRPKLSFAGFAAYYLLSPVVTPFDDPIFLDGEPLLYWAGGLAVLAALALVLVATRHRWATNGGYLWLLVSLAAALLPVSSMTEGQRYLYLASVVPALWAGRWLGAARGATRHVGLALVMLLTAVSTWQVRAKAADWQWASDMTREAIALVDGSLAPSCGEGHVVLLTAPVGQRGIYTHLYRESFALPRNCAPARYSTIARVVRADTEVSVEWEGPRTLRVRAPRYTGNWVLSHDLRSFDVPLRSTRRVSLSTPLGLVKTEAAGDQLDLRLTLAGDIDLGQTRLFYYSAGALHQVPPLKAP